MDMSAAADELDTHHLDTYNRDLSIELEGTKNSQPLESLGANTDIIYGRDTLNSNTVVPLSTGVEGKKFSTVDCIVILYGQVSSVLTFEKFESSSGAWSA